MKIYSVLYCGDIHDSAYGTISIHRTKAGAFNAMRKHKLDVFLHWYNSRISYGKYKDKHDDCQDWNVKEYELLD